MPNVRLLQLNKSLNSGTSNGPRVNGHVASSGAKSNGIVSSDEGDTLSEDDVPLSRSTAVKSERPAQELKRKKAGSSSDSDSDVPLAASPAKAKQAAKPKSKANGNSRAPTNGVNGVNGKRKAASRFENSSNESEEDDDDIPLGQKQKPHTNGTSKLPPKKKVKVESEESSDDEDDQPLMKSKNGSSTSSKRSRDTNDDSSSDEDDKPLAKSKPAPRKKVKKEESPSTDSKVATKATTKATKATKSAKASSSQSAATASPKKGRKKAAKDEEEEEEEVYKWWEQDDPNGDGSVKWQTLEHNGVYFPPPYETLPKNVKMKYAGKSVDLPPASEEVAGFFGAMLDTDHAKDSVFSQNFFNDFLKVLKANPPRDGTKIEKFELCDFRPMLEYFEAEKAKKKALSGAERKELKKAKDKLEEKYTTCVLDGRKEKVGNFRIEPPGLFRGRGEHPKKGSLKLRVRPEDITINIQKGVPIPVPNVPGKWKKVLNDQTVTWLANWTENVNGQHKYVFLAAGSSLKGQSDMQKFEKARELKKHVDRIRADYTNDLKTKSMADRQRATAMYFIDRLALRAGNEKGEDEADTVGCCSLRCEHVTLEPPNFVVFDFLGKDSIRYYNRVEVDAQIFKNIRIFKENKNDDDALFDRVNTGLMNKHLQSYMKGLTAKVFRTYNASITFQRQLDAADLANASVQEKLVAYNAANRMVAILCNHQRAVPKTHSQAMEKMGDRLRGFKYERMKLRHVMFEMEPKMKKKKQYAEDESDLDDDWIASHEENLKAKEIEKAEKKFAKENEKLVAEGKESQNKSVLKSRLADIEEEFKRLEEERGTKKATLKRSKPTEKIEEAIGKLDEKLRNFKLQMHDREEGKEVSLGTSKINYLDPRITSAWCKKYDVPIEKLFSKTLLVKFPWAMEVDTDWKF